MPTDYFEDKHLFMAPKTTQYGSHMVMTDVSKESKTKYINMDTRFRDEYNYLNSSTTPINMNYTNVASYMFTLADKYNDVKSLSVSNIEIPLVYYNISANLGNNCLQITGTTNRLVIIPDGQYTAATLTAKFLSLITTDISINVTQNGATQIVNKIGTPVTVNFNYIAASSTDAVGSYDKFNTKFKLGWLLGFRNITYTIAAGATLTSEAILDLNGPRYLYLVVDEFSNGNQNSFVSCLATSIVKKNILARIAIDNVAYPYGSVLTANPGNGLLTTDHRSYTGKIDIQRINVQLVNENGAPVNLNGMDFSFCLKVVYE
jgi:hypothetical protein